MKETAMTRTIPRLLGAAAIAACALMLAACGGDDDAQDALPGVTPTTITPQGPDPNLASVDGYLISATETAVVLHTADGQQTFAVAEEDLAQLGIGHLASHAGIQTLGFRVFYPQKGDQRFVKAAQEIAPPPIERPAQPTSP